MTLSVVLRKAELTGSAFPLLKNIAGALIINEVAFL